MKILGKKKKKVDNKDEKRESNARWDSVDIWMLVICIK